MVTGTLSQKSTMTAVANQTNNMPLKEVTTQSQPTATPAPPVKSDRRSNKPIMEKRRRARINNCLNELKTLILDATKKDPARHSKLEKADILEKTVKHLQELQRQQSAMAQAIDPKIVNKFKLGFTECANEVSRFPDIDPQVKRRLMQHLSNCINGVKSELSQHHRQQRQQQQQAAQQVVVQGQTQSIIGTNLQQQVQLQQQQQQQQTNIQQVQIHMLPSPPSSPEQDHYHNQLTRQQQIQLNGTTTQTGQTTTIVPTTTATIPATHIQSTANGYFLPNGVQVYPTKLSNGTYALILPQQLHQQQQHQQQILVQHQQQHQPPQQQQQHHVQSQLPMLVPIPNRTASTGSTTSVSSSYEQQRTHTPTTIQQHLIQQQHQQQQSQQIHYAPPSPANSYEAMDCQYNSQQSQSSSQSQSVIHHASSVQRQSPIMIDSQSQYYNAQRNHYDIDDMDDDDESAPLSLVIKKHIKEEEQPWRPW